MPPRNSSNAVTSPSSSNAVIQRRNVAPPARSLEKKEVEEVQCLVNAAPFGKKLSKQLSLCETHRDVAWEKRRRQILRQEKRRNSICVGALTPDQGGKLTDADLHELKGSIELEFGFKEEEGHILCNTLPALELYFAVKRQLSASPVTTPRDTPRCEDCWRICGKGDDPQQVKTKLRHWAQAVACSLIQTL